MPVVRTAHYTARMGLPAVQLDIAIIGGGVAGLWALNHLRGCGYSAALFEHQALGSEQTGAAQGIIHSGIKYQLAGAPERGADRISAMPDAWRDCLAGRGAVDLRGCRVLSEHVYLWTNTPCAPGERSAGEPWRAAHQQVHAHERPMPLQAPAFCGQVYRTDEPVLDIASLVATLSARQSEAIFRIDWRRCALHLAQGRARLALPHCTVNAACLLLTAGAGNAALVAELGGNAPAMQRRPLQQVLVKHQYQPLFFAHCVGSEPSPRLTISSHRTRAGEPLWSLGGQLATAGAHDEPAHLIAHAQQELATLLPWLELGASEWRTLRMDRAEPQMEAGPRADRAFLAPLVGVENALVAWPVKLCLCPDLGNQLLDHLAERGIAPRYADDFALLDPLGRPPLAPPCWDSLFP